jgi:hypothetical protein
MMVATTPAGTVIANSISPPAKQRMNPAAPLAAHPPRCHHCCHYYITHDIAFRYGCRALGFKSRGQPGRDVLDASGEPCRYFEPKPDRSRPP